MSASRVLLMSALHSGVSVANRLTREGLEIVGVITVNRDYRDQSKMRPEYFADMAGWGRRHNANVLELGTRMGPDTVSWVSARRPDWIICVGWPLIVPSQVRRLAGQATLGAHASLLPQRRGGAPLNWALIDGLSVTGVSILMLEGSVDAGPLVWQRRMAISPDDEIRDLIQKASRLLEIGFGELAPDLLSGRISSAPQDHRRATWTRRRRPGEGRINWRQSSVQIHNLVRAVAPPFPGATTTLRGRTVGILKTREVAGVPLRLAPPGTILTNDPVVAVTGDYLLELETITSEIGDEDARNWAQRMDLTPGERLT